MKQTLWGWCRRSSTQPSVTISSIATVICRALSTNGMLGSGRAKIEPTATTASGTKSVGATSELFTTRRQTTRRCTSISNGGLIPIKARSQTRVRRYVGRNGGGEDPMRILCCIRRTELPSSDSMMFLVSSRVAGCSTMPGP